MLHFISYNNYELHRDELLFFNQGDFPGLGNATVPPFIGWVAFAIKWVFGYSVFGIKLLPALLGGISVLLISAMVKELGGSIMALTIAVSAYVFSPGFLLVGSLFTVNVFDQFFWLIIIYLVLKMVLQNKPGLWILIGFVAGIAFLNKYLIAYLMIAVVFVLLIRHKKLLLNRHFLTGCLTGLIIISPNIYWQFMHGWPVLHHISELEKSQMVNMTYRNYLIDLFDLNYLISLFCIAGLAGVIFFKAEKNYRFAGLIALFVFLLVMFSRGKAYYALGIFPVLYVLGGYIVDKYFLIKPVALRIVIPAVILFVSLLALPYSLPLLSFEQLSKYSQKTSAFVSYPFSRWEDGEKHNISQVFSDMTGWSELAAIVDKAYRQIPEDERKYATIYAERNYGYAGAIHFYGKQYGLPEAITFLDSYTLWAPDTIPAGHLIYINYDVAGMDKFFSNYSEVGTVENKWFRERGLKVFLFEKPFAIFQQAYSQKAMAEKSIFKRKV